VEMENGVGEWGKQCGRCCFCGPCEFGYIFAVVEEGVCVRDCRGLGLYKVGMVGC
jgi:hypothetical protein